MPTKKLSRLNIISDFSVFMTYCNNLIMPLNAISPLSFQNCRIELINIANQNMPKRQSREHLNLETGA
jgi:hypothetical protein